jgi:CheY-like chemotaxis protein/HPt (histidine-containing phosphotransfer) domain-containing protein
MPQMDGFDVIDQIDTEGFVVGARILMLSSAAQLSNLGSNQDHDPSCSLIKPVGQSELRAALLKMLGHAARPVDIEPTTNPTDKAATIPALRILLADDNVVNQKLAVRLLEKQGHSVVVAGDGKQALEFLSASRFDLAIMDVQMPVLDGFEATAALRAWESQTGGHLPVIALTANAMKGDRELCLRAGFDDYVAKPIRWPLLAAAIEAQTRSSSRVEVDVKELREAQPLASFDLASALERVGGDLGILKEVAEMFLQESPLLFSQLVDAVQKEQAKTIEFAAHKLRGAASTFVSQPIDEVVTRLERLGALGQVSEAWEAMIPLPGILDQLKLDLDHLING